MPSQCGSLPVAARGGPAPILVAKSPPGKYDSPVALALTAPESNSEAIHTSNSTPTGLIDPALRHYSTRTGVMPHAGKGRLCTIFVVMQTGMNERRRRRSCSRIPLDMTRATRNSLSISFVNSKAARLFVVSLACSITSVHALLVVKRHET
jgi:hypothetical protein